jgi:hypothetical protein
MDVRAKVGVTAEGLPCTVTLYYPSGALEGAPAERVTGLYQARDGAGAFEIVRDCERYRDADTSQTHAHAHALTPWVVSEGRW